MNEIKDFAWLKNVPTWIKTVVGLISLVVTFILLILNNFYLGIIVIVALLLASGLGVGIYVAFSKKESAIIGGIPIYRFPKYRPLALVGIILIIALSAVLVANERIRSIAIIAFYPTPQEVSVEGFIIAEAQDHYRIEATAFNPLEEDIFVNHVGVYKSTTDFRECMGASVYRYELSNEVIVNSGGLRDLTFEGLVSPGSGELSDYQYVAQGHIYRFCGDEHFGVGFDTSVILAAGKHTTILVDVPKMFHLVETDADHFAMRNNDSATEQTKTDGLAINLSPPNTLESIAGNYRTFSVGIELVTNDFAISHTKHFFD